MPRLLTLVLPALAVLLPACSEDRTETPSHRVTLGQRCAQPSECTSGTCSFGLCRKPCNGDGECAGDLCFSDGRQSGCRLPEERACARAADCGDGLVCAGDSSCRVGCTASAGCALASQSCEQGGCTPQAGDAGTADAGHPDSSRADTGTTDARANQASDGGRLLCDGAPCVPTMLCEIVGPPGELATDGEYFATEVGGALRVCRRDGSTEQLWTTFASSQYDDKMLPSEIIVASGYAYYRGDAPYPQICRVPLDARAADLNSEQVLSLNTSGSEVQEAGSLAILGDALYITYPVLGEIARSNLDGTGRQVLVTGEVHPMAIASDGARLIWANDTRPDSAQCSVVTAALDGSDRRELTALRGRCLTRIRADRDFLFFQQSNPPKTMRSRADGSEHTDLDARTVLALHGPHVYLSNGNTGVDRMPRAGGPRTRVHDGIGIAIDGARFYFRQMDAPEGVAYIPAQ